MKLEIFVTVTQFDSNHRSNLTLEYFAMTIFVDYKVCRRPSNGDRLAVCLASRARRAGVLSRKVLVFRGTDSTKPQTDWIRQLLKCHLCFTGKLISMARLIERL